MSKIRKPAVAGTFYPAQKEELQTIINKLLDKAEDLDHSYPKAVIVPHAGYIYSGSVAASAYKPLRKLQGRIKKIVLLGPSHHLAFQGLALSENEYFQTPLGQLAIDQDLTILIKDLPQISFSNQAHESEHSLEVHLPFLQEIFGNDFTLLPIVVGDALPESVGEVIEKFWGQEEVLIVVSTDLSHYHDYMTACQLDIETCYNIEDLKIAQLEPEKLCGAMPVKGLLYAAKNQGLKVKMVDFCNSGDSEYNDYISVTNQAATDQGSDNSAIMPKLRQRNIKTIKEYLDNSGNRGVVGYGSYYIGEKKNLGYLLSKPQKLELLRIAYQVIEYGVKKGRLIADIPNILRFDNDTDIATFVTLEINGNLRGCIGTLEAHRNIVQDVINNAFAAAFHDPRFAPITKEELEKLDIHISVLSPAEPIEFSSQADLLSKIRPGIDGLILSQGNYRATFLPSVWEELSSPQDFLNHLKMKAGFTKDYWSDSIEVERYSAELVMMEKL